MKLLSIILPIYKVEKYIRDCILSIFRQGLSDSDFEIVLVNDGSPDNSIGIMSDIISAHDNIIVVNQENQGVSIARNNGFLRSCGKYVLFMDPDDMLVDNALSILLPKAIQSSVDLLVADYQRFDDGNDYSSLIHVEQNFKYKLMYGEDAFLDVMLPQEPWYIWRMLINRDFLVNNQIDFKPFWYEDSLFCHECFLKSKSCLRAYGFQLYVYRLRKNSFTTSTNVSFMFDLNSSMAAHLELVKLDGLSRACKKRLMDNIFSSFNYGLYCIVHNQTLYDARRIIISDLKRKIPASKFMFVGTFKQMIVSFLFRYIPFIYLWLRYHMRKS